MFGVGAWRPRLAVEERAVRSFMTRDHVLSVLHNVLPRLRERFGVESIGVFGSIARGDGSSASDVDVLVRFRAGAAITLFEHSALLCDLEDALGCPVDLVEDHERLRPEFRRSIERDVIRVA